jgi:Flp pilus assembly protein TadG
MNKIKLSRLKLTDQRGAAAILVAVSMLALLGFAAIAVDTGYLMVAKNELQNVADASALAATRQLGAIYEPMTHAEQLNYTCDPGTIFPIAQNVAQKNKAGGKSITVKDSDVVIGQWNSETHTFTPTLDQPDAVKVTARRDASINGPVTTFFAKILGIDTADVTADAIAALTGQSTVGEGGLDIPVGISAKWFEPGFCNQPIKFYPTGSMEGCAGWHTFTSWPANANKLRTIMEEMTPAVPTFESPEAVAGTTPFVFTGGNVAAAFDEMSALYEAKKNPVTGEWETVVVVYESGDCSNPTGNTTVLGFATAIITGVNGPGDDPAHTIFAEVKCDNVEFGRGSGGNYGTKGSIPGLVE